LAYDVDYDILSKVDYNQNAWVCFDEIRKRKAIDGRNVLRMSDELLEIIGEKQNSTKESKFWLVNVIRNFNKTEKIFLFLFALIGAIGSFVGAIFAILSYFSN
jgi:hypothetical protein